MTHLRTTYFEIVLREKNRISIIFTCHELKLVEDESLCVEMIVLYQFRVYYLGWVEGRQNFTINVFMYCRNEFSVKICMKLWRSSFVTIWIVNMLFVSPTQREVAKTHVYPAYQFVIITKGACYTSVAICMNVQYAIFTSLNFGNE